uniref:Putative endonuclease/reverse transcript n=1 Tax=Ixodes ricinus TaxID=34613 RepID=A0A6B0V3Z2_IXORI
MAWTVNVAFIFLVLRLTLAVENFTIPLGHIHNYTQMINNLLRVPKTFYVVGGTFEKDPLMDISPYPFKCGEVEIKQRIGNKVPIERSFLEIADKDPKKRQRLTDKYDLEDQKSPGYNYSNFVDVYRTRSHREFAGSMYLLLSDSLTCALFYNNRYYDCELWVTDKPAREKATNVSFCGAFVTTCNDKTVQWYYNYDDCYKPLK